MIVGVRSGEEVQHRDARRVEGHVVARPVAVAARPAVDAIRVAGLLHEVLPLGRGLRAEHLEAVVPHASDHVHVEHGDDVFQLALRLGRPLMNEVRRAEHA